MEDYQSVVHSVPKRGTHATKAWYSYYQSVVHMLPCLCMVAIMLLFASCNEPKGLLPPSGGRLYEVLLVGDKDDIVKKVLQEDVSGLPQSEPQFDVSSIDESRFNQSVSMARNIVQVDIDPKLYSGVRLRYEKDVWAQPQMVVHVNAPSVKMLRDSISRIVPALLRLLNRAEINKSVAMLKTSRNIRAEKLVKKMFGIEMWIPQDMMASRRGKNYLWLSNNSPSVMTNLVIFKAKDRNSILYEGIKGETDSMHMQIVEGTVSSALSFRTDKDEKFWLAHKTDSTLPIMLYRGLWAMTGDDMGGPFVSRTVYIDKKGRRQHLVVEGFVFAPGKKKRNAIKQLEAALYTIKY